MSCGVQDYDIMIFMLCTGCLTAFIVYCVVPDSFKPWYVHAVCIPFFFSMSHYVKGHFKLY